MFANVGKTFTLIEDVPHIPQEGSWDCGLACLRMTTRYLKPLSPVNTIEEACKEHNLGKSVWTIDLAYLCQILDISHQFCTKTLGVDSNYRTESFYMNEMESDLSEEEKRVNLLFSTANDKNVKVEKRSVDLSCILKHLETEQPIIVLINDKELHSNPVDSSNLASNSPPEIPCCFWFCCWNGGEYSTITSQQLNAENNQMSSDYWGHFVVIVGYDLNRKIFFLNDPSPDGKHVQCTFETLERARKSYGTDEDILFLYSPTKS
uniref:protein GUCD1-like isoform X1 n=1 Tax=Styela clava TaxID=7725 RepID=UPI00193A5EF3|nr:protein GUCD1-like isoform X1 [Styela clava]